MVDFMQQGKESVYVIIIDTTLRKYVPPKEKVAIFTKSCVDMEILFHPPQYIHKLTKEETVITQI